MTANDDGPDTAVPRRTHRLLTEADVRARFSGPVADYLLAVRGELVARFGEVDTYRRFAGELAVRYRRSTPAEIHKLARRRAEHFNNPAGPPWRTTEEVLRYVVAPDRHDACRERYTALYIAARGEPPPGPVTVDLVGAAGTGSVLMPNDELMFKNVQLCAQLGLAHQELRTAEERAAQAEERAVQAEGRIARMERAETAMRIQLAGRRLELAQLRGDREVPHPGPDTAAEVGDGVDWLDRPVSGVGYADDADVADQFAAIAERYTDTGPAVVPTPWYAATTLELPCVPVPTLPTVRPYAQAHYDAYPPTGKARVPAYPFPPPRQSQVWRQQSWWPFYELSPPLPDDVQPSTCHLSPACEACQTETPPQTYLGRHRGHDPADPDTPPGTPPSEPGDLPNNNTG